MNVKILEKFFTQQGYALFLMVRKQVTPVINKIRIVFFMTTPLRNQKYQGKYNCQH